MLWASPLLINEVSRGDVQWVEIYNPNGFDVNITGWRILNSEGEDNLEGVVKAHSYLIIISYKDWFDSRYPSFGGAYYELPDHTIGSGMRKERDLLILLDKSGKIVDFVNWGNPDPNWKNYRSELWRPGLDIEGDVIGRLPNGVDTDRPEDWRRMLLPSPGGPNQGSSGLDVSTWGKIKALFSVKRRG
jgi:hypothetical protein